MRRFSARFRKALPFSPPAAAWRECWRASFTPWKRSAGTPFGTVPTFCRWMHFSIEPGANGWGATPDENAPILLNALQEQMLWEQMIRESPAGASLLQIPETARQAIETWRLVVEYRLPVDGSFEASQDWAAFASWSREFQRRCSVQRWLERARLTDFLRDRIEAGQVPEPKDVFVAGFDEMTPQQAEVIGALGNWRAVEMPHYSPAHRAKKAARFIGRDPQRRRLGPAGCSRRIPKHKSALLLRPISRACGPKWSGFLAKFSKAGLFTFQSGHLSVNILWCAALFSCWISHWASCPCRAPECCCDRPFSADRKKNGASAHSWTPGCAGTVCGMYLGPLARRGGQLSRTSARAAKGREAASEATAKATAQRVEPQH